MHHRLVLCLYNDQHCKSCLTLYYFSLLPNPAGCIQHCQFLKNQTLPDDWPGNQNKEVAGPATPGSSDDDGSSPVALFTLGTVAFLVVAVAVVSALGKVRRRQAPPTHALHPDLVLAACESPDDDLPSFPGRMT
jgi:hypothetical protein